MAQQAAELAPAILRVGTLSTAEVFDPTSKRWSRATDVPEVQITLEVERARRVHSTRSTGAYEFLVRAGCLLLGIGLLLVALFIFVRFLHFAWYFAK